MATGILDVVCIGHAAFDIAMAVDHHPAADEKMQATGMNLGGGGPAANAAVAISRLGGHAAFCGYLGRDIFGEAHATELASYGVDTRFLMRGDAPSPVSMIAAKPDGSRSLINYKVDTPWLAADAVMPGDLEVGALLFDGHEPLLSKTWLNWAEKHQVLTLLDAGSVHRGTEYLASRVDVLAASERFAADWTGQKDMHAALAQMREKSNCVVITMGERGLLWAREGESGHIPSWQVAAIDSTGAGDAFHGALAYAMAQSMPWLESLYFASAVGGLTCTRLGVRHALPVPSEVHALLSI